MKPKIEEVQRLLSELSTEETKQLRKENVFRNERNAKIQELYNRGVKMVVIAEASGLSETMINRIAKDPKYKKI